MDARTWKIGEVATATGLTVRALHHYDRIGLVVPSIRTPGGHRLYTSDDLVLLYEVTAMRQLGLSLEQIGAVMAKHTDVQQVIDEQLRQVDRQIRMAERLRARLEAIRDAVDGSGFTEIIRLTHDMSGYLSKEQISTLHRRMSDLGVVADHAVSVEMPQLYGEAMEEMRAGTPPSHATVRRIVDRLDELAELIRGPDTEIGAAARTAWLEKGGWSDLIAYMDEARAARDLPSTPERS
ncbi:MAG TPA: MerR family transcriptional regulator [Micromonosporaceae bacterium]|jgi:DNA-binding transcriptional MerR regulator